MSKVNCEKCIHFRLCMYSEPKIKPKCSFYEEPRPQGEWIITGEEQGAFGITYNIRKCNKCGWEHSLIIPNNFCPNCGADMRGNNEKRE